MKNRVMHTAGAQETIALGQQLGSLAQAGMVFLLEGDLGAGKTTLTQGIARGLGVSRTVKSPTFNLLKIYEDGRMPLYHMDAYRLEGVNQDLGFDELLDGDGLSVIEWPQFVPALIPEEYLKITITLAAEDERDLLFEAVGQVYEQLLEELK